MALPKKKSRTIDINGRVFRWYLFLDDDYQQHEVIITADDVTNGSQLFLFFEPDNDRTIITPRTVRQAILAGLEDGFDPDAVSTSFYLSPERHEEILQNYPRELTLDGTGYTWTPDSHGGLHMKIRATNSPSGQLLATALDLEPSQLLEDVATSFIKAAKRSGWRPEQEGLDCFWLEEEACRAALSSLLEQA